MTTKALNNTINFTLYFFFIFFSLSSDKSFLKHATMLPIYHTKVKKKMKKFLYSRDIRAIDYTEYKGIFVITE